MLTIEVELLTGRYAATAHNDRGRAEWPPHPARFFSALVAALHEREPVNAEERAAVLWLEQQDAPDLEVDAGVDRFMGRRKVMDVFVPVNDVSVLGDVGGSLREAEADLSLADALPGGKDREKARKSAAKGVEKARKKLEQVRVGQSFVEDDPSASDLKNAGALIPEHRIRQVRTFPVIVPERTRFAFRWCATPPASMLVAFASLLERVTRLGHSSSLVRCAILDREIEVNLVPREDGELVLRTVAAGQLERLEREFERHQGIENRVLPARPRAYGSPHATPMAEQLPQSVFAAEWIVFERVNGARLLSSRGKDLMRALRAALLESHGGMDLPPALSGHHADGSAANRPHVAFVALPFVGHEHADASIQGCAIIPPRDLAPAEREVLFRLVGKWERERSVEKERFTMELGGCRLPPSQFRRVELSEKATLRPSRWTRSARRFVTATPIALDRNPGDLRSNRAGAARAASLSAQLLIGSACERIGLPRPSSVEVSFAPLIAGAERSRAFGPWPGRPGMASRVLVHAELQFDAPVRGPILLGAGRFFGLGLCLPLPEVKTS